MKVTTIAQLAAASVFLLIMTACGADHHGHASGGTGGVPRPANFAGLWMGDAAYREFRATMGDQNRFCAAAAANPARHGLSIHRLNAPSTRIFQIENGGTVRRWAPGLTQASQVAADSLVIGGIDNAGRQRMPGYRRLNIGALRFDNPNHLSQINGDNVFPMPPTTPSSAAGSDPRLLPYPDQSNSPDRERAFTRVDAGFAEAYVSQIQRCFPACYGPAPVTCPTDAGAGGAATLPTVPPNASPAVNDPTAPPVDPSVNAPTAPVGPRRRGHRALPKESEAVPAAPTDQTGADRATDQAAPVRPGDRQEDIGPQPGYDPANQ